MDFSDELDEDEMIINDYEELMGELDLELEPRKLPELLQNSSYFNKQTIQNKFEKEIKDSNSKEAKIVEITRALKLKMSVPLHPQLFVKKVSVGDKGG